MDALLPKTRQAILAAVFIQPQKEWYASELARHIGVRPSSLQRELGSLTEAGVLIHRRQGNLVLYHANTDSPIFPELRGLLLKTAGLVNVLSHALRPFESKVQFAFVYGSIARGRERSESDVDLMVVGTVLPAELVMALRAAQQAIGREINPTLYSQEEFAQKRALHDPFLMQVLAGPKLFVIGSKDDLARASGEQHGRAHARHEK
ncbi:MAG: nucleotidyltransferase domain-containing protein [Gammaproteobacteria bacterium]|nr:nucleotidyltransferase domain-containing protein [Gammaproteobacteria bacterium]